MLKSIIYSFMWPILGIPGGSVVKKKKSGFNPWVRKSPWRRKMATHSSILAWRIPWTEEPGGLLYSAIVRHSSTHTHVVYTKGKRRCWC